MLYLKLFDGKKNPDTNVFKVARFLSKMACKHSAAMHAPKKFCIFSPFLSQR